MFDQRAWLESLHGGAVTDVVSSHAKRMQQRLNNRSLRKFGVLTLTRLRCLHLDRHAPVDSRFAVDLSLPHKTYRVGRLPKALMLIVHRGPTHRLVGWSRAILR